MPSKLVQFGTQVSDIEIDEAGRLDKPTSGLSLTTTFQSVVPSILNFKLSVPQFKFVPSSFIKSVFSSILESVPSQFISLDTLLIALTNFTVAGPAILFPLIELIFINPFWTERDVGVKLISLGARVPAPGSIRRKTEDFDVVITLLGLVAHPLLHT